MADWLPIHPPRKSVYGMVKLHIIRRKLIRGILKLIFAASDAVGERNQYLTAPKRGHLKFGEAINGCLVCNGEQTQTSSQFRNDCSHVTTSNFELLSRQKRLVHTNVLPSQNP